jgi:hypothetical protein
VKLLLDSCVTVKAIPLFSEFDISTARQRCWQDYTNGDLLEVAQNEFDVIHTLDRNLRYQNPVHRYDIGLVVVQGVRNTPESIAAKASAIISAIRTVKKGEVVIVD